MFSLVNKPWGKFQNVLVGENFLVKQIEIFPHSRFSLQKHFNRDEVHVIVKGSGILYFSNDLGHLSSKKIVTGDVIKITRGQLHRIENDTDTTLVIVETQIGVCDENDIQRFEDDYGRA